MIYSAELRNQSKRRIKLLQDGLTKYGGTIISEYWNEKFVGKRNWRSRLYLRISLPRENRFLFILETHIWLKQLTTQQELNPITNTEVHDYLRTVRRRTYRVHPTHRAYITTYHKDGSRTTIEGIQAVGDVLGGDLHLVLEESPVH